MTTIFDFHPLFSTLLYTVGILFALSISNKLFPTEIAALEIATDNYTDLPDWQTTSEIELIDTVLIQTCEGDTIPESVESVVSTKLDTLDKHSESLQLIGKHFIDTIDVLDIPEAVEKLLDKPFDQPIADMDWTIRELKSIAKWYKIPKYGKMNKIQLIEAIEKL